MCGFIHPTTLAMLLTGGWYALAGAPSFKVPSKDVVLLNNLVYNPANESAKWAHFSVSASPTKADLCLWSGPDRPAGHSSQSHFQDTVLVPVDAACFRAACLLSAQGGLCSQHWPMIALSHNWPII